MTELFVKRRSKKGKGSAELLEELCNQTGQLKVEPEWLKKT